MSRKKQDPLGYKVELPCGFFYPDGERSNFYRDARVSEMLPGLLVELGSPRHQNNREGLTDLVIDQCLMSIGERPVHGQITDRLLLGDKHYLVLQIRKFTKTDKISGEMNCPECKEKIHLNASVDDFDVFSLDDPTDDDIERGFRIFKIEDKENGYKATFRHAESAHAEYATRRAKNNPVEYNNYLMLLCLQSYDFGDGEVLPPYDLNKIKKGAIRYAEYEFLLNGFLENMPGPDMLIHTDCYACGLEFPIDLNKTDFLLSPPKKRSHTS